MGNEESKFHHADSGSPASAASTKHHKEHERYSNTPLYVWINKKKFVIPREISPRTKLSTFLHDIVGLTGTKVMCGEGGCGNCMIHVTKHRPDDPSEMDEFSVNSCLMPVLSCAGWQITTIEGIGNTSQPHDVQKRMQEHGATQCGYCTPGFCMQQYSTIRRSALGGHGKSGDGVLTEKEMWENAFDGNICRCTGYRAILDCAKSFVNKKPGTNEMPDENTTAVEDLALFTGLQQTSDRAFAYKGVDAHGGRSTWYRPATFDQLWQIVNGYAERKASIRFVAGNTSEAIYNTVVPFDVYIDIQHLPEMSRISVTPKKAEFGSLVTLTMLIEYFELNNVENYSYWKQIAAHLRRVANHGIRNVATWAGNLMIKHDIPAYPSDVCTLLTAAQAQVEVRTENGVQLLSVPELMQVAELGRTAIISKLILPPHPPSEAVFYSFKVVPRAQSSHAYVNAAFLLPIRDADPSLQIYELPVIAYGGLPAQSIRAVNTEAALRGASVAELLQGNAAGLPSILSALTNELMAGEKGGYDSGDVQYRTGLARNLLYKMLLYVVDAKKAQGVAVDARIRNAWQCIERPISHGKHDYNTVSKDYPVTKPIPKVEALMQTTGQLQYTSDLHLRNQLYAAPVLAPLGPARLVGLVSNAAARAPGFVRIITSADIPGKNSCAVKPLAVPEVLLVDINGGQIDYAGQAVALVLAETQLQATTIAQLIEVQCQQTGKPLLTCQDAIRENSFYPNELVGEKNEYKVGDVRNGFKEATVVVEGEVSMGQQYRSHSETQVAVAEPVNYGNNMVVHAATQWPDQVVSVVAQVCGLNVSQCDVIVRPVGGESTRNTVISCLAAVAACLTRRPVKLHLTARDNLRMMGGRIPYYAQYKIGVGADNKLKAVHLSSYCNMGALPNDYVRPFATWGDNAYKCDNWLIEPKLCKTNIPPNTYALASGSAEAAFFIETAMEHAAHAAGVDPLEFRRINYYKNGDSTLHMGKEEHESGVLKDVMLVDTTDELLKRVDYKQRQRDVDKFNANNRWKKRGYSIVPLKYGCNYTSANYCTQVVAHHADGSVAITHAGVEIGQGINTQVAQVAAHCLGIPLDRVTVKPTISLNSANTHPTDVGITSEMICYSVTRACEELKQRIAEAPVHKVVAGTAAGMLKDPLHVNLLPWVARVAACYLEGIDLTCRHWINGRKWSNNEKDMLSYNTYAAMYSEVELDVLTGEKQVRHVELVHDAGQSLSPLVDIAQAEAAIVTGLGLYLMEYCERDESTGKLLTEKDALWEFKPPTSKDIPVEMNVTLWNKSPNKLGMLQSKSVGESPLVMTCSTVFALQHALREARKELRGSGKNDATNGVGVHSGSDWVQLGSPATTRVLGLLCGVKSEHLAARA